MAEMLYGFFNELRKSNPMYGKLILKNIDVEPFSGDFSGTYVPTMTYLLTFGKTLELGVTTPDNENVRAVVMAELLNPVIGNDQYCGRDEGRMLLVASVKKLTTYPRLSRMTRLTADGMALLRDEPGNPHQLEEDDWTNPTNSLDAAMRTLTMMARQATRAFSLCHTEVNINIIVAIAKRGNITQQFADKMEAGMDRDINIIYIIHADAISRFWSTYGNYINDTNVADIINRRLSTLMPAIAARLRSVIQQASGGGLTTFTTIGRAIRKYPDFDWRSVSIVLQNDWANFAAAERAVGGNKWYGYRQNLAVVKSTNYKDLAYVAKELLIGIGGDKGLAAYQGWTKTVKYKSILDKLIVYYKTLVSQKITRERRGEIPAEVQEIINRVTDEVNDELFQ